MFPRVKDLYSRFIAFLYNFSYIYLMFIRVLSLLSVYKIAARVNFLAILLPNLNIVIQTCIYFQGFLTHIISYFSIYMYSVRMLRNRNNK